MQLAVFAMKLALQFPLDYTSYVHVLGTHISYKHAMLHCKKSFRCVLDVRFSHISVLCPLIKLYHDIGLINMDY